MTDQLELKDLQELQSATYTELNIKSIKDKSDKFVKRIRICFKNNFELSIIKGMDTYGSKQNLFEIAIFNPNGDYCPELFEDVNDRNDDVLGYQSEEEVIMYINKISLLTS